jgi:protease I
MGKLLITTFLTAAMFASAVQAFAGSNENQSTVRIVMIVAPKDFTDQEYFDLRKVFENAGARVRVASTTTQPAVSHNLAKVRVDQAIPDIRLDQVDAIVVVGGMGAATYLMNDESLRNLLVAASKSNKVVSAICIAPAVLARAGVLRNREATCYADKTIIGVLKMNGAAYLDRKVVVSGRIVTGNGPDAAKEFATTVLAEIGKS